MRQNPFIEVEYFQKYKARQHVAGDAFLSKKLKDENRVVSVLSDGLGSGVKANVLSTLTATMALNYISNNFDIQKTASVIMKTLPVCRVRKISYSTFTIVDLDQRGVAKIIEYDNPSFLLVRDGNILHPEKETFELGSQNNRKNVLRFSQFNVQLGDRIVLYSDGVTQSGIGSPAYPLGWGEEAAAKYVNEMIKEDKNISARELAKNLVQQAERNDGGGAADDITCGVINIREPRKLLVMSGPPISKKKDPELARIVKQFTGKKIICGGTTANIISRELGEELSVNLTDFDREIPPTCSMKGIDLITEGTITLAKVVEILEKENFPEGLPSNGATKFIDNILNSDIIEFVVGTKINDAHQDPNVPVELEIRRNIFKRIIHLLEEKHLKTTSLQFI